MSYLSHAEFDEAIETNRSALIEIIATLCAMIGFGLESFPKKISRALKSNILMVLSPAESAVRRLVFSVMETTPVSLPPVGGDLKNKLPRMSAKPASPSAPLFALFDAKKNYAIANRRNFTRTPPHIRFFHIENQVFNDLPTAKEVSDEVPSFHIINRLKAIQVALGDLPKQARRMAKAIARRERLNAQNKLARFTPIKPMRVGSPPGYRRRKIHKIDNVLERCMWLARQAQAP